jgi:uroporphyrinogen-III synthase
MSTLLGLRVLNTRPKLQAQTLSQEIINAHGQVIECPLLEINATATVWMNNLPPLDTVDIAVFISSNAVHYCFEALLREKIQWPQHIHNIAIGHATAKTLQKYHIAVHDIPDVADSEHLLECAALKKPWNKKILLFKGIGGRPLIEQSLLQQKAGLHLFEVYERTLPKIDQKFLNSIWQERLVDIILLTSEESMQHLFLMFGDAAHDWLCDTPCLVLGHRLAQSAASLGFKKVILSRPNQIMDTLFDYYQSKKVKGLTHDQ